MKKIAVIGAGIIGICSAYFLQKSGFKVTLVDHNKPGSMTSYGHACTFADYACIPVNSPTIFKDLPSMLLKQDGPLSIDFRYILKWNENNSPLKRNITADDISGSAIYLLSDLSSGVTGEVHHVDSGYNIIGMKDTESPDIFEEK